MLRPALATALLLGALAAPLAAADEPACDAPGAVLVHEVEEAAAGTPAGPATTPVLHDVVEPVVCP